ncbi:MAG: hypothetical protein WD941_01145 [Opitutus sp.]
MKPLARIPLRKSAMTATAASRRPFPAWIDADECVAAFSLSAVRPRIRDRLVLRTVRKRRPERKDPQHADHGR